MFFILLLFLITIYQPRSFLPYRVVAFCAEIAALTDSTVSADEYFQGGVVHHAHGRAACWFTAIGLTDKDEQLVGVAFFEGLIVAKGHTRVLKAVDDHDVGTFMLAVVICLKISTFVVSTTTHSL